MADSHSVGPGSIPGRRIIFILTILIIIIIISFLYNLSLMERRKICRYFERGSCKKQKCPFVHLNQNRKNCEFFMQGFCRKGANCNFYHPPKQNQQVKEKRNNFKPTLEKKPKREQQQIQEAQQFQKEEQIQTKNIEMHEHNEPQQKIQQKIQEKEEKHKNQQQFKKKQINFLLGLGGQTSSDEQQSQQLNDLLENQEKIKRKPLNFLKTYPKKFPDYTKSVESKQKILQNQKLYFKDVKFVVLLSKTEDPIQKQHLQILRKFQDSYTEVEQTPQQKQQKGRVYTLNIRPLLFQAEILLHFQMTEDFIQLKIVEGKYPTERAKFQILNISIPEQYKQKLTQYIQKVHKKKSVFQTLKTVMNNFQKIYEQIKSKLQNEYYSQIELEEKIKKKLSEEDDKKMKKRQKKQKKTKAQNLKQKQKSENPDLQVIHFQPNQKINVSNMTYQIQLDSLLIHNAEYIVAERILLYIQCQCQKELVHILEADRKDMKIGVKLKCKKCKIIIPIAFIRQVMQLRSQVIGKLGIQNGRLLQVGGISWKIGCSCDTDILKSKICLPGYRLNANCHLCFKQAQVSYMGLGFHNPFYRQNQLIENGKQLPNKGACKHFKLSFRWVRYGCCGRRFSCDQCHISRSIYPHQKIQGFTMVCGFCSYEQLINKQCVYCKRQLVRGVDKNGHWQGGLGCRDKNLLSKKDAKKYAGLTKQQKDLKP